MKQTDINGVREVARMFLYLEPEPTRFSPAIIKHPFADSGIVMHWGQDGQPPVLLNIMEDEKSLTQWRKEKSEHIGNVTDLKEMFSLLTKSYYLAFLKFASPYMSRKDYSEYLASAWIMEEAPNGNPNFTPGKMTDLFKRADPQALMSQEEYQRFQQLPEKVTIYRGVTGHNAKRIKALSWTLSKDTAEWFAHRFGEKGTVYQAQISKAHIFALFNGRNESEVIVDPKYLKNITSEQKSQRDMTMTM